MKQSHAFTADKPPLFGSRQQPENDVGEEQDFLRAEKPETPLVIWPLDSALQSCRLRGMASRETPAEVWRCPSRKPRWDRVGGA